MWLLILEALGALCLLVFIVWWTMFCGRRSAADSAADSDQSRGGNKNDKG